MLKRILAMIMSILITVSSVPVQAFAAEIPETEPTLVEVAETTETALEETYSAETEVPEEEPEPTQAPEETSAPTEAAVETEAPAEIELDPVEAEPALSGEGEIASGTCGEDITWVLTEDGVLTLSGTGVTDDYYGSSGTPWNAYSSQIESVVIGEGITGIGMWAFAYGEWTEVSLPEGLETIGYCAFFRSYDLQSVEIPESVTTICDGAFYCCESLKSVVIPAGVTCIEEDAFSECRSLCEITFEGAPPAIHENAFKNVMAAVYTPEDWPADAKQSYGGTLQYTDVIWSLENGVLTFSGTGPMTDYTLYNHPNVGEITSAVIEDGVTTIGAYAFYRCENLTSVVIPDSVVHIGEYAFAGCGLNSLDLPDHLKEIENNAFAGCSGVRELEIPESVTTIGASAFFNLYRLEHLVIPAGVTEIGERAFSGSVEVDEIIFEGSAPQIGTDAFESVKALVRYPEEDPSWTESVMQNYGGTLTWSNMEWTLEDGVLTLSGSGDMSDFYSKQNYSIISQAPWWPYRDSIKSVVMEDGITSIGSCAFYQCQNLTSVVIPDGVTSIGDYAFCASSLAEIEIPDSVSSIGAHAFAGCMFSSVTIPENVTAIAPHTFESCKNLTEFPVHDGITSIGESAFRNCESLTEIALHPGITSIADWMFAGCSGLTEVTIPDYIVSIGDGAFDNCYGLTSVEIPEGIESIPYSAFEGCNNLKSIIIPASVTSIGCVAFRGAGLREVTFLGAPPEIDGQAFAWVSAAAYYPVENPKWTAEVLKQYSTVMQRYDANLYWTKTSWTLEDGVLTISGSGPMADIAPWADRANEITAVVIGEDVTAVGAYAFENCHNLKTVTIPAGVTKLGDGAFRCSGLQEIIFEGDPPQLGEAVFGEVFASAIYPWDNPAWTSDVIQDYAAAGLRCGSTGWRMENGILTITGPGPMADYAHGAAPWSDQSDEITGVVIEEGVTTIANYAFAGLWRITDVTIPETVTKIGEGVFASCSGLTTISIPGNVTEIGDAAFSGCDSLTEITLPDGLERIGNGAFSNCRHLEELVIPDGVTSIGASAFAGCKSLTTLVLPDGITDIGGDTFGFCDNLAELLLPKSLKTIGDGAFTSCYQLRSLKIPAGVVEIGRYAFEQCNGLREVIFEGAPPKFDDAAFLGVNTVIVYPADNPAWTADVMRHYGGNLSYTGTRWTLEDGILTISGTGPMVDYTYASVPWYSEYEAITGIVIEEGVTTIGDYAFQACRSLTEITIPDSVVSIGNSAFASCGSLTEIMLPDGVVSIGNSAFASCGSLTEITLPDGVVSIGNSAFDYCGSLTEITIPDSVVSIGNSAFASCSNLREITIPASVTSIGEYAFQDCRLNEMIFEGDVPEIHEAAFCDARAVIRYPEGNETWTEDVRQGYGGNLAYTTTRWTFADGVLTISGNGPMADTTDEDVLPWSAHRTEITDVVVEEGVTSVGSFAFSYLYNLKSVSLPDSVTRIGNYAFCDSKLTEIVLPEGLTDIGMYAFNGCEALTTVTIPETLVNLGEGCFFSCNALTSVSIPGSVVRIPKYAFYGCSNLRRVTISDGVTAIGDRAFYNCELLTRISVPASVTSIGECAFWCCRGMTRITLKEGLESIGNSAFVGCSGLREITIPSTVTSMGTRVFEDCHGMETVTLKCPITEIGEYMFKGNNNLTSVTLPDTVRIIGENAFQSCGNLNLTLPEGLQEIKEYAFYYSGTGNLVIPDSVTTIAGNAFKNCYFSSVTMGSGVKNVGTNAFYGCPYLKSVELSSAMESVSDHMFYKCYQLTTVIIPDGITAIGYEAFADCTKLTTINIPTTVSLIDECAFAQCSSLQEITIPDSVEEIGLEAFYSCTGLNKITFLGDAPEMGDDMFLDVTAEVWHCGASNWEDVISEDYGGRITWKEHDYTFVVTEPSCAADGYTTYTCEICGEYVADEVESLEHTIVVDPGYSATCLDDGLSEGSHCDVCGEVLVAQEVIPAGHKYESQVTDPTCTAQGYTTHTCSVCGFSYQSTFVGATGHTPVVDTAVEPTCTATGLTEGSHCSVCNEVLTAQEEIPVAGHTVEDGQCTVCGEVDAAASGDCGNEMTWVLDSAGNLRISGSGSMDDYAIDDTAPWYDYREQIAEVRLADGIADIGDYAFWQIPVTRIALPATVTEIGYYAFAETALKILVVPGTVERIDVAAFSGCTDLVSVTLNNGIATIGEGAFGGCTALTSLQIPASVNDLQPNICPGSGVVNITAAPGSADYESQDGVLYNKELTKLLIYPAGRKDSTFTVPGTVTEIGYCAFDGAAELEEIILPEGLEKIGGSAFLNCANLARITIPASVTAIGICAFENCPNLNNVTFLGDATSKIEPLPENGGFALYPNGNTTWTQAQRKRIGANWRWGYVGTDVIDTGDIGDNASYELSTEGTLTITGSGELSGVDENSGESIFAGDKELVTEVVIAEGVTSIGESTFSGMTGLTSVTLPETVTEIGSSAFSGCEKLEEVILPESVTSIGDNAFENCASLTEVVLPQGITDIGDNAFENCASLTEVALPQGLTVIGDYAFNNCSSLSTVSAAAAYALRRSADTGASLPEGITEIGEYAFANTALTSVVIPDSVTTIGSGAFQHCYDLQQVSVGAGVVHIGDAVFYNCSSLTTVRFSEGINSIPYDTFSECVSLKNVNIPSTVTEIGDWAFNNCALTEVVLPEGLETIGGYAFQYCPLKTITIPGSVTWIGSDAFSYTPLATIYFQGDAPEFDWNVFSSVTATVRYPAGNTTWDGIVGESFNGSLTWIAGSDPVKVELMAAPSRKHYQVGDSEFDLTGLKLLAEDVKGYSWVAGANSGVTVTDWNTRREGEGSVTLSWMGFEVSYDILLHEECVREFQNVMKYPESTHNYSDNMDKSWVYNVPGAVSVDLTFSWDTYTEDDCDFIYIYDRTGRRIGTYSGDELAGVTVTVPGDTVKIRMTADSGSCDYFGFSLDSVYALVASHENSGKGFYTEATCQQPGYTTYTCNICGVEYDEWDETVGDHSYVNGKCAHCGKLEGVKAWGEYDDGENDIRWMLREDGQLILTGKGNVYNYNGDPLWHPYRLEVTSVTVGQGITILGDRIFRDHRNLEQISLPESLREIYVAAFYGCSGLTELDLPEGLTHIYAEAFWGCTGLREITVPASVTFIGEFAFNGNRDLEAIRFLGSEPQFEHWDVIEHICIAYYPAGNASWEDYYWNYEESGEAYADRGCYWLPDNAASDIIARGKYGDNLTWVLKDDYVLTVTGSGAMFDDWDNWDDDNWRDWGEFSGLIREVELPQGLTTIGSNAIAFSNIRSVTIPDSVTVLGSGAFSGCAQLKEITIPASVTSLGDYTFGNCENLTSVTFLGDMPEFGENIFYYDLVVRYPADNVTWDLEYLSSRGWGCNIRWVPLDADVLSGQVDYEETNYTWLLDRDGTLTVTGSGHVDGYEFEPYRALVRKLVLSEGITHVDSFGYFTDLEEVVLPSTLYEIGYSAFCDCTALREIEIPAGLSKINGSAFENCTGLRTVRFNSNRPEIDDNAFVNVAAEVTHPAGNTSWDGISEQNFGGSLNWVPEGDPRGGSYGIYWHFDPDTGKLTVSGEGDLFGEICLKNRERAIRTVEFCEGITGVWGISWLSDTDPFMNCFNLTEIIFPESLGWISGAVFTNCTALKEVEFPASMDSLSSRAFDGCTSLKELRFNGNWPFMYGDPDWGDAEFFRDHTLTVCYPSGNTTWLNNAGHDYRDYNASISWKETGSYTGTFHDGIFWSYDPDTATLTVSGSGELNGDSFVSLYDWDMVVRTVIVEEGITSVGRALANSRSVERVILPDSVESIGEYAFCDCTGLKEIRLPANLKEVGHHAFYNCSSLETIELPDTLETIGSNAFLKTGLKEITIPASVTWMGDDVFHDWDYLWDDNGLNEEWYVGIEKITFLGSVPGFNEGEDPFNGDFGVAYYPANDASWSEVNWDYFGGTLVWRAAGSDPILASGTCGRNLTWKLDETFTLTVSGTGAMYDYDYDGEEDPRPWAPWQYNIRSIVVENGVTTIGNKAFENCENLETLSLPVGLVSIGDYAFSYYNALTEVTLPKTLTSIGDYAFYYGSIREITVPASVQYLGESAFSMNMDHIVHYLGDPPELSGEIEWSWTNYGNIVFYPAGNAAWMELVEQYPDYALTWFPENAQLLAQGRWNENISWTLTRDGTLTIRGEGDMGDFLDWDQTWFGYDDLVRTIIVEEGITSLCDVSNMYNLESVILPESITSLGSGEFYGCVNLREITLPDSLTSIGENAFAYCINLAEIRIPANVSYIDIDAFNACCSLKKIYFDTDAPSIERSFGGVTAEVYYPAGNDTWDQDNMLDYGGYLLWKPYGDPRGKCGDTLHWRVADGILTISGSGETWEFGDSGDCYGDWGAPWRAYADQITHLELKDGLTAIGAHAFRGFTGLTEVDLPENLQRIDACAFYGCTGLTAVEFPGTLYDLYDYSFYGCTGLESMTFNGDCPSGSNFTDQTITAYYPPMNTSWNPDDLEQYYGDNITWIASGEPRGRAGYDAIWTFDPEDRILTIRANGHVDLYEIDLENEDTVVCSVTFEGEISELRGSFDDFPALQEVYFRCDAPEEMDGVFCCNPVVAYHPEGNATWTEEVFRNLGENAFWMVEGSDTIRESTCGENLTWVLATDGTLTISGTGEMEVFDENDYHIWERYRGLITKVIVNEGVTKIAEYAFESCTKLEEVQLPASLETIGYNAFAYCENLKEITLPEGMVEIQGNTFEGCYELETVHLPSTLKFIAPYAFAHCYELKNIELPEGLDVISENAFYECDALISITIPESVRTIGYEAFAYCDSLGTIWFQGEAPRMDNSFRDVEAIAYYLTYKATWDYDAMSAAGGYIDWRDYDPTVIASGEDGDVRWTLNSSGVLVISGDGYCYGDGWREYIEQVKEVVVRDGVQALMNEAFYNHKNLTRITIPASVSDVRYGAFRNCTNLKYITFGHTAYDDLGMSTALGCDPLYVLVPDASNIHSEITDAFGTAEERPGLYLSTDEIWVDSVALSVEDDLTRVEAGLKLEITAAPEPWYGNMPVFWEVNGNAEIIPDPVNPWKATFVGLNPGNATVTLSVVGTSVSESVSLRVLTPTAAPEAMKILVAGDRAEVEAGGEMQLSVEFIPGNTANKNVVWEVESITGKAEIDGTGLLKGLKPGSVTVCAISQADPDVSALLTVEVVRYVEEITMLLDGEAGLTQVGSGEEYLLSALVSPAEANAQDVTWTVLDGSAHAQIELREQPVYTPRPDGGYTVEYKKLPYLRTDSEAGTSFTLIATSNDSRRTRFQQEMTVVGSVESSESGIDGGSIYYNTATGMIVDVDDSVTTANIPVSIGGVTITGIDDFAFVNVSDWGYTEENTELTTVRIPRTVTRIGNNAFERCTALRSLQFVASEEPLSIGTEAFRDCSSLVNLTIPDRATDIGYAAFYGLDSLKNLTVSGEKDPGSWIIDYYDNLLETLTVTGTEVAAMAFDDWDVKNIVVSEGVTAIGERAFACCYGTTSISLPDGLLSIGEGAFEYNQNLIRLNIPDTVAQIGRDAFGGCYNLQMLDLSAVPDTIVRQETALKNLVKIPAALITATGGKSLLYWNVEHDSIIAPAHIYRNNKNEWFLRTEDVGTIRLRCYDEYTGAMGWKDVTIASGVAISTANDLNYLISGKSLQLTALQMPDGDKATVTWSIESGDDIATISSSGKVTAKSVDMPTSIYVAAKPAYGETAYLELWILPENTGITIMESDTGEKLADTIEVDLAEVMALTLVAEIEHYGESTGTQWTTSNAFVAACWNGAVQLLSPGTAKITAKDAYGNADTVTVNVIYRDGAKKLTAQSDIPSIGLQVQKTAQLQILGNDLLDNGWLEFTSNNNSVATVDDYGTVYAVNPGSATITAKLADDPLNRSVSVKVTVIPAQTETVTLVPDTGDLGHVEELEGETEEEAARYVLYVEKSEVTENRTFTIQPSAMNSLGEALTISSSSLKWATTDAKIATVKANADGTATVTLVKGATGACAITAVSTDLAKIEQELTIHVRDYTPRMDANAITLNTLLEDASVELGLVESYGNTIQKPKLYIYDSGTKAYVIDARLDADWTDDVLTIRARNEMEKGTYKLRLEVSCANDEVYTFDLKLTVKNEAPKVTVKQAAKMNLFLKESTAELTVTAKDAVVTGMELTETEDFTVTDGVIGQTEAFWNSCYANESYKPDAKGVLLVSLEGYRNPVEVNLSVGTVSTAPKLTLTSGTSVINTALTDSWVAKFRIIDNSTGEALWLSGEELRVVAPEGINYTAISDEIWVGTDVTSNSSATLYVRLQDWNKSVKLTHKISIKTTQPAAKLSVSTLKLNKAMPWQSAYTMVTLDQDNMGGVHELRFLNEIEGISTMFSDDELVVSLESGDVKTGNHTIKAIPYKTDGTALKEISIKISVTDTAPTVKLKTGTLKLNTFLMIGGERASTDVIITKGDGWKLADFRELEEGTLNTREVNVYVDGENGRISAWLNSEEVEKDYSFNLTPILENAEGQRIYLSKPITLKIQTYHSDKLSATLAAKGKLDLVNPDSAIEYTVKKLTNTSASIDEGYVYLPEGELDNDLFEIASVENGVIRLKTREGVAYSTKQTYQVQFELDICTHGVRPPVQKIKVTQSALKISAPKTLYFFQSQRTALGTTITLTAPEGATIDADRIRINAKQSKDLLVALGSNVPEIVCSDGETVTLRLRMRSAGRLVAGKSYPLVLDVLPVGCASDMEAKPTQVKITVKVMK